MPPQITYWTGNWNPTREAISKEIEALRASLSPSSPVVAFAPWNRTAVYPRTRVLTLASKRWLSLRAAAAVIEPRGDITHVFGSIDSWHLLRSLGRRPLIMTVVIPGEGLDLTLYDKVAMFAAESEPLAAALAGAGVSRARIRVIYPGVDLARFAPAPAPEGRFKVLFASTPADTDEFDVRGVPLLMDLARRRPDVEIIMMWRRWGDQAAAQRALAALNPPANVRIEHRDVSDMASIFQSVHAVVACFAQGFGKSCPNSIIEGLACARPALLTQTCGIAGLVTAAGAGLATCREADALATALDTIRANYAGYFGRARALAESRFDERAFVRAYGDLYEEINALRPRKAS